MSTQVVLADERRDATAGPSLAEAAPNLTPPPGNPRFPLFDSLRAIAALSVFLGHTITATYSLITHRSLFLAAVELAYEGVAIFFLISGFLLYRPFLTARRGARPLRVRDFARRRLLRIVPAYWAALTIFLALGLVGGITVSNGWQFYAFGQIYSTSTIAHGIGAAWTLCVEMTFYVALPLFAFLAARLWRGGSLVGDVVLLVTLSIASLAFRAHFRGFAHFATAATLPGTFVWFALGMGLAVASVADDARPGRWRVVALSREHPDLCWVTAFAGSLLLYGVLRAPQTVALQLLGYVLYGVVALLVLLPGVFGDRLGGRARGVLRHRLLAWVGLVSYAVYLYHTVVIAQVNKLLSDIDLPLRYPLVLLLAALITCACAAASYYLLERPIMRLRLSRRARREDRDRPSHA